MYDDRSQGEIGCMFDTYRSAADLLVKQQDYEKAAASYTAALELFPEDRNCLVARSRCFLESGDSAAALKDAEAVLKSDPNFAKGILCKADSLYYQGDFEMALVFYHRGNRIRPEQKDFRLGIQKCQEAIDNSIGGPESVKLENKGDLSHFHKYSEDEEKKKAGPKLVIGKLQNSEEKKVYQPSSSSKHKSVKHLLGELYADKSFLEALLKEEDERIALLDTCPKCGYRLALCTCSTLVARDFEAKSSDLEKVSIPLFSTKYTQRRTAVSYDVKPKSKKDFGGEDSSKRGSSEDLRLSKTKTSEAIHQLVVGGLTYLDTRTDFWRQQRPMYARKRDKELQQATVLKRKESDPAKYVLRILSEVDDAQSQNKHEESLKQCKQLLRMIQHWTDAELPSKADYLAHIHSYMGNAYLEMGDPNKALLCHRTDLDIAEKNDLGDAKSRAKDNIGRVYARSGRFQDAINMWEAKLSTSTSDLEKAWLYHEIGRCYLELDKPDRAKRDGELALRFANKTDDGMWQLNASVLIGQSEMKMGDYLAATDSFERSMELAKLQNDKAAQDAIVKALEDINDKIVNSFRGDLDAGDAKNDGPSGSGDEEDEVDGANEEDFESDTNEGAENEKKHNEPGAPDAETEMETKTVPAENDGPE